jgi:hypothetical protein
MKLKRDSPPEAITSGVAIALSTSASGTIRLSRTISGDDNGVPTLDVIEKVGKVSLGLRGLNFAHGGRRRKNVKGRAFRMFSQVDPVPGLVVPRHPLDLRSWGAGWRRTRAWTRTHLTSMSISIAAKVRAGSAGDRCRPRPTTRLHRRNCEDPGGAAGRPGLCIHRSPFGREHGAEQTECDGPRLACGRTQRTAKS